MIRAVVVILAVFAIAVSALLKLDALGSAVGIVVGVVFLAISLGRNNGLVNASLRRDPDRPNDPNAGIAMGLAAAGIALGAMGNQHYPPLFHRFYIFCMVAGLAIGTTLAIRYRKPRPVRIAEQPADDKVALVDDNDLE